MTNKFIPKGKISLKTKIIFEELIQRYCELEQDYAQIHSLTEDLTQDLDSLNLPSDMGKDTFQDVSAHFPCAITHDFINYMKELATDVDITKEMTSNEDISDDNFYEILVDQRNIEEFFDIIESHDKKFG